MGEDARAPRFDDAFWDGIAGECWGKKPFHIPNAFPEPFMRSDELLEALRNLATRARAVPGNAKKELYYFAEDYTPQQPMVGTDVFPRPDEATLVDYFKRLQQQHGNCCIAGFDIYTYLPALWDRICSFVRPLVRRVGQPGFRSESILFVGEYAFTSTGIHKDSAHVTTFVLEGTKIFHLWPDDYQFKRKELDRDSHRWARDFKAHLDGAITFVAHAGDLLYWPLTYWHVVESPVYSNSLTFLWKEYDDVAPKDVSVAKWLAEVIAMRARDQAPVATAANPVDAALERFCAVQEQPDFSDTVWRRWLERTTRLSFDLAFAFPDAASIELPTGMLVANDCIELEWSRLTSGRLLCAASGESFEVADSPGLATVMNRLVSSEPWTVAELEGLSDMPRGDLHALIRQCMRVRAVIAAQKV